MAQYETTDQILMRIVELKNLLEIDEPRHAELKAGHKDLENLKDMLHEAYQEALKAYQKASTNYHNQTDDMARLAEKNKTNANEIETLRRMLSRMEDNEKINAEYQSKIDAYRLKCSNALWRPENRDDGKGAFPHQLDGAIKLAVAKSALLGDKRGLGKTLTSIIWNDLLETRKVIAIVPGDTMENFIREVNFWSDHRSPVKIGGMPKAVRDFTLLALRDANDFLVVVNYEAWRKDPQLIDDLIALKADTLMLDEAHNIKTEGNLTNRGVKRLRFGLNVCPNCGKEDPVIEQIKKSYNCMCECGHGAFITEFTSIKNVLPMTGTPILNKPQDLYPILHLVDPKNFQSEDLFLRDFCRQYGTNRWTWAHKGEQKIVEKLGERYLARTPDSAGVVIPPQSIVNHIITKQELEERYPRQFKAYEQARTMAQILLDPDRGVAMSMVKFITVMLRLRQVLAWPAAIQLKWTNPDNPEIEEIVNLDVEESAKVDMAEKIIKELVEEGKRILVFSQFRGPLHELHRRLGAMSVVYDGSTSRDMRNQIELDFDPKTAPEIPRWPVALFNYRTGGVGLNLQAATETIFMDREWNPGKEDQAMGRTNRIGQTKETTVHIIKVTKTVDAYMESLIEEKKATVDGFESNAKLFRKAWDDLRKGEL